MFEYNETIHCHASKLLLLFIFLMIKFLIFSYTLYRSYPLLAYENFFSEKGDECILGDDTFSNFVGS